MYVGGRLFGRGAFINNTWQTLGRLFGRGVYLREGRLFEQIWYIDEHALTKYTDSHKSRYAILTCTYIHKLSLAHKRTHI